jgi:NADP-dependent 3-hydroxy acid dehydrogenase YdfG
MTKTILITGASSGIGAETTRALLAAGHIVYAGARRIERMNPLIEAGARVLSLDVTHDTSMTTAVQSIVRETGRIDVLINNAGYGSYGALEDGTRRVAAQSLSCSCVRSCRIARSTR